MDRTDYIMLQHVFKRLGLYDYIDMELDENKLYIRIYEFENKRQLARELINEINEMTKETGSCGIRLS